MKQQKQQNYKDQPVRTSLFFFSLPPNRTPPINSTSIPTFSSLSNQRNATPFLLMQHYFTANDQRSNLLKKITARAMPRAQPLDFQSQFTFTVQFQSWQDHLLSAPVRWIASLFLRLHLVNAIPEAWTWICPPPSLALSPRTPCHTFQGLASVYFSRSEPPPSSPNQIILTSQTPLICRTQRPPPPPPPQKTTPNSLPIRQTPSERLQTNPPRKLRVVPDSPG